MALTYAAWLKASGRSPTAANAQLWKTTHGVALGLYNPDGSVRMVQAPVQPEFHPTDPIREQGITDISRQIDAQAPIFNTRRSDLATNAGLGLVEGGLLGDYKAEAQTDPVSGRVTYRLIRGQDGRLYSQAYAQTRDTFSAHGLGGSSFAERAGREAKLGLDTRVAQVLRQFDTDQRGIGDQESEATYQLGQTRTGARQDYADWQAQQTPPPPVMQPARPPAPPKIPVPPIPKPPKRQPLIGGRTRL